MAQKKVTFIAIQRKNEPVQVNFYTKGGERVSFDAKKSVPVKTKVSFYAKKK